MINLFISDFVYDIEDLKYENTREFEEAVRLDGFIQAIKIGLKSGASFTWGVLTIDNKMVITNDNINRAFERIFIAWIKQMTDIEIDMLDFSIKSVVATI